jgi:hypothetical protein
VSWPSGCSPPRCCRDSSWGTGSASPAFRARLRDLHEPLAVTGLAAIAAQGILLLGDPWLDAGPIGMVVPFTLGHRPP